MGSSPLARGLPHAGTLRPGAPGIIPARAGFTRLPVHGARGRADHPRSRGVYRARWSRMALYSWIIPARAGFTASARSWRTWAAGSSPLARGLHQGPVALVVEFGIIPARAGFTPLLVDAFLVAGDHPRSRGVYSWAGGRGSRSRGSSPLARGLRHVPVGPRGPVGIIPARAGFTRRTGASPGAPADHPRSRGVYSRSAPTGGGPRGSSPLARGLRGGRPPVGGGDRIIPARAGFTSGVYTHEAYEAGSSPLARGLRRRRRQRPDHCGIIPARAGFTAHAGHQPGPAADHPRSRGVYTFAWAAISSSVGSSPLARGLRGFGSLVGVNSGIIPARAGFTTRPEPPTSTTRDHPRSRGVYATVYGAVTGKSGSSPLARGLPWRRLRGRPDRGIIPARAGFTRHAATRSRRSRDHPRSRGVYSARTVSPLIVVGSSPLARGLPDRRTDENSS